MKLVIYLTLLLITIISISPTAKGHTKTNILESSPIEINCDSKTSWIWNGKLWHVKNAFEGPGPNHFSNSKCNVWVDYLDQLHLKITDGNDILYCAEVYSEEKVGYGEYIFYISSPVDNLDKNVVFGLYTWDGKNCLTNANSELDIEFTRAWMTYIPLFGYNNAQYSVQPTNGKDLPYWFNERFFQFKMPNTPESMHRFSWKSNLISWESYYSHNYPPSRSDRKHSFQYNNLNDPRRKTDELCTSEYIRIPSPGTDTRIRLNLYLHEGLDPIGDGDLEVIIKKAVFIPEDKPVKADNYFIFLIDLSWSMSDTVNGYIKIEEVKKAIPKIINELSIESSAYALITYYAGPIHRNFLGFGACDPQTIRTPVIIPFTDDKNKIIETVNMVHPVEGSTPMVAGIKKAFQYAENIPETADGMIILLADGQQNCPDGNVPALNKIIRKDFYLKTKHVKLSTIAYVFKPQEYGQSIREIEINQKYFYNTLEKLASEGNGIFVKASSPNSIAGNFREVILKKSMMEEKFISGAAMGGGLLLLLLIILLKFKL